MGCDREENTGSAGVAAPNPGCGRTRREVAGAVAAAVVSTLVGHPLDTAKVYLQARPELRTTRLAVREILLGATPQNNPLVLYRGALPPLCNAMVMNTVMFAVFGGVKAVLPDTPAGSLASGLVSGVATACISTPTDYVKIHAQLTGTAPAATLRAALRGDPRCLLRGHTVNILREGVFTMVYLGVYDTVARRAAGAEAPPSLATAAAVSACTGCAAWVVSYPFDTVKTIMQRAPPGAPALPAHEAWREVWGRGPRGVFRGCLASTGRAAMVTSTRMLVYEWVLRHV